MARNPLTASAASENDAAASRVSPLMARHIPHLFVPGPWQDETVDLAAATCRHLEKVLRLQAPAQVTYTDGAGMVGSGTWTGSSLRRGAEEVLPRPSALVVAVAPPKNTARLRFIVEKLGEIGVKRLVWLITENTSGRTPQAEKTTSWAVGALEQSRGAWLLEIDGPVSIADLAGLGTPVFAEQHGASAADLETVTDPVLCIGPEGGFAPMEIPEDSLRLSLGATVLRVETAAVVGAARLTGLSGS